MQIRHSSTRKTAPIGLSLGVLIVLIIGISAAVKSSHHQTATPGAPTPILSTMPSTAAPTATTSPSLLTTQSPTPTPALSPISSQAFNLPSEESIPILMYHYIRDFHDPKDKIGTNLSVAPPVFAKQLVELKSAGYTTITFKDLQQPLPAKPIILTFDDGYEDAYTTAFPALQKEGMKAVFYIVSQFVNTPAYVTTEQVKDLDKAGMEIGSHTINHADLSKQTETQQLRQLTESKQFLEQLIGKPVTAFCYPSGKYNETTLALDKKVGYTSATTTHPGVATGVHFNTDPYQLTRVRVTESSDLLKVLGDKK